MRRLVAVLCLLVGCSAFDPSTSLPYVAPPVYRAWYEEVEGCAYVAGDYDRLTFYALPEDDTRAGHARGHEVWVRGPWQLSPAIVKHEMLHTLIGDNHHDSPAWRTCGLFPLDVAKAEEGM